MTEEEINDATHLVFAAWGDPQQEDGPHPETREAIGALAAQLLIDIHRASVALTYIAQHFQKFKGMPVAMAPERRADEQPRARPLAAVEEEPQGHG